MSSVQIHRKPRRKKKSFRSKDPADYATTSVVSPKAAQPVPHSQTSSQTLNKPKKKKKKAHLRMSFADEDEEPAFQIKKHKNLPPTATRPKRPKKQKHKKVKKRSRSDKTLHSRSPSPSAHYAQHSTGLYTERHIADLKRKTKSVGSDSPARFSKSGSSSPSINGDPAINQSHDSDNQRVTPSDDDNGDAYMSQGLIRNIKMRREIARRRNEGIFVPLEDVDDKKIEYGQSSTSGAFLREEADDRETVESFPGEHSSSRTYFGDPGTQSKKGKIPMDVFYHGIPGDVPAGDGQDDEFAADVQEHELQQMRKSGIKIPESMVRPKIPEPVAKPKPPSMWNKMPKKPLTIKSARYKLQKALEKMKESSEETKRSLENTNKYFQEKQQEKEDIEKQVKDLEGKYIFFQKVRDEVRQTCTCLGEKAQVIETACEELCEYWKDKYETQRKLYALNVREEYKDCFGITDSSNVSRINEDEISAREIRKTKREKRRLLQKSHSQKLRKQTGGFVPEMEDGWKTDEDSDTETQFREKRRILLEDSIVIFRDAHDELQTFDRVQECFQKCKDHYPEAYQNAFVSMSVPTLLAPYVQLESMRWEPLLNPEISSMSWYNKLEHYGSDKDNQMADDDEDQKIIPKLIEKDIIPFLNDALKYLWNPFSEQATKNAIAAVLNVIDYVDDKETSKDVGRMLRTVLDRIEDILSSHLRPEKALAPIPAVPKSIDQRSLDWRFCSKRWWTAMKFLVNLLRWKEVIDETHLQDIAFRHISTNLLPFLRYKMILPKTMSTRTFDIVEIETVFEMSSILLNSLPAVWIQTGHEHLTTLTGLLDRFYTMMLPYAGRQRTRQEMHVLEKIKELSKFGH